ncbi:MAG: NTP transferase domain-containing protein [Candidatus Eisenbacteria bacterium]|nr:NTP transferase domain-containing protein [Candidatus Eisenbacteria bacterium]
MKAMILAAGMGTRLGPLTKDKPKALVEIANRPLLALLLTKLRSQEITGVVVNAYHRADQIERFVKEEAFPDGWVRVLIEERLLGTGGGVRNAARLLGGEEPVLVHNVDVLSNLPFRRIAGAHEAASALATLAVGTRRSGRSLAADEEGYLCGRWGEPPVRSPRGELRRFAYNGIQFLARGAAASLPGEGAFSIIDSCLEWASRREEVRVFPMDDWYWAEAGTVERLERLKQDLARRAIPIESLAS